MPRTAAQFEAMRQASQEKIIKSACKLFTQFGFQSTSISMIARDSGFSGGLIYAYFNDKEHLLDRVLAQTFSNMETVFAAMTPIDPSSVSVPDRVDLTFDLILKRIDCLKLMIYLNMQEGTPPKAIEQIRQISIQLKAHMDKLFPETRCANLPVMIHAAITNYLVFGNEDMHAQQRRALHQLAERYQDALLKSPASP